MTHLNFVAAIGLTLASVTANAEDALSIIDSNGRRLGPVVGQDALNGTGSWLVPVFIHQRKILLGVSPDGSLDHGNYVLNFPTVDCSGPGYIVVTKRDPLTFSPFVVSSNFLYVPDLAAAQQTITMQSFDNNVQGFCDHKTQTLLVRPALAFDFGAAFKRPFKPVFGSTVVNLTP